mgnify:FL=1
MRPWNEVIAVTAPPKPPLALPSEPTPAPLPTRNDTPPCAAPAPPPPPG